MHNIDENIKNAAFNLDSTIILNEKLKNAPKDLSLKVTLQKTFL
jgi:hypothetical protein